MLFPMKNLGMSIFKEFRRATAIILTLFVLILISSCSPETIELCRVGISTEYQTRDLTAKIITDSLNDYNIYYRSIYKGTGNSYGDMSNENGYRLLDSNGILVSQGLWEIEVIFKAENVGSIYSPTDISSEITGTTGITYINLNTSNIAVSIQTTSSEEKGSINIKYSLTELPATALSENPISLDIYSYNGSLNKVYSSVALTNNGYIFSGTLDNVDPGIYFAVFTVTGTISRVTGVISVDTVGFVVRPALTTLIEGVCNHYYVPSSNSNVVIVKPGSTGTDSSNKSTDIRDFLNSQFTDNTIYQIDNSNNSSTYYLYPSNDTFVKTLENNTDITIDTNGVNVVNTNFGNNSEKEGRTYFVLNDSTSLSLINSKAGTQTMYGCSDSKIKSQFQTNFRLNGGTLKIGTNETQGQLNIKGCSASAKIQNGHIRHAAIELSPFGGAVSLIGGNSTYSNGEKLIQIEDSVIGIGTDPSTTSDSSSEKMNISINVDNAYINAQGDNSLDAYGIYINEYKKTGSIIIKIDNKAKISSSKTSENGCGIYIKNFNGSITIIISGNSEVSSTGNYGIHIDGCKVGSINISKSTNSTVSGALSSVYINGESKTFNTDGTISIPAKN